MLHYQQPPKQKPRLCGALVMVSSRIFGWNTLTDDLISLYYKLVELGVEYVDGEVRLPELDELEVDNV